MIKLFALSIALVLLASTSLAVPPSSRVATPLPPALALAVDRPAPPLERRPISIARSVSDSEGIRGITIAPIEDRRLGPVGYGSEPCARALEEVAALGSNWISLTPFGRMDDLHSTDILHDFEIPVSTNEELLRQTAVAARANGLKIAIIPHIYVMSGRWRGEIDPGDHLGWDAWFAAYERFVLRFARLAEELDADLFSIGVEFKSSSNYHDARWRNVIQRIRTVYSGPLTYSANWDEIDQVEFWDALDLIGINAFWPLVDKPGDAIDTMLRKTREIAGNLESMAVAWNRPVLFTEMGIKSTSDAALAPWEWPENVTDQQYNEPYQAAAYQAIFEEIAHRPWFAGLFVWKYFADPYDTTQEAPEGFSPRGKQAERVLCRWFERSWKSDISLLWAE